MEVSRRSAHALAPVLLGISVALLALLAYNLRNLDPGTESLPPPVVSEPPAGCTVGYGVGCDAPEGVGSWMRALFLATILTVTILTVVGAVLLRRRGVKLSRLVTKWELLGYAAAVLFLLVVFVFYGHIKDGLAAFIAWASGTQSLPGSGGSGENTESAVGSGPATAVVLLATGIVVVYLVFFAATFFPKFYDLVTYEAPDVGRSKRELARAVRTAIRDLESGGDFRTAVLRCYKSMVLLFESRGLRADPAKTAREFEADALGAAGVSREGIDDLTSLFEEARYSRHDIGERQRDAALESLRAIRSQLEAPA